MHKYRIKSFPIGGEWRPQYIEPSRAEGNMVISPIPKTWSGLRYHTEKEANQATREYLLNELHISPNQIIEKEIIE